MHPKQVFLSERLWHLLRERGYLSFSERLVEPRDALARAREEDVVEVLRESGELLRYYSHHLRDVLRLRRGSTLKAVLPGSTPERALLAELRYQGDILELVRTYSLGTSPPLTSQVTAIIPLLKGDSTERLIGDLAQLGVQRLVIFSAELSVRRLRDPSRAITRYSKVALRNMISSRRWYSTYLRLASSLEEAIEGIQAQLIVLDAEGEPVSRATLTPPAAIISGPEGGLSEDELKLLDDIGARKLSLGPLILRAELAPVVAVSKML